MRKAIAGLLALGLIAGFTLPAFAGKTKTKKGSFTAVAVPYPVTGDVSEGGCLGGIEGVNKKSVAFKPPANGVLSAKLILFELDWDFFITDAAGNPLATSDSFNPTDGPGEAVSASVAKGKTVYIVACNWAGGPTARADWVFKGK